ncbi:MAG: DUF222 domain-containing protein [Microbacteriaceae bacterium]|nr:DUF222 domain-containing protein [Microbacteriaceae bacterium]
MTAIAPAPSRPLGAAAVARAVPEVLDPPEAGLSQLDDEALLTHQNALIARRRRIDIELAAVAGEIARRSDRTLGFGGLAARLGARSAEQLIAQETGVSVREAGALVRVGSLRHETAVAEALASGAVSVATADAIISGLGGATMTVGMDALESAAADLLAMATDPRVSVAPEDLAADARALRAALDATAVIDRERELRARRSLRLTEQPDGMTRLVGLLDPESAAIVRSAYDAVTAPRRGGPRPASDLGRARAARTADDARTTEQLALDAFVDLIRLAGALDADGDGRILGGAIPAVRIHVTDADLARRSGRGVVEGRGDAVAIASVERQICAAGTVPIHFDSAGQVVNVGREQRLYTRRQRIGLAARDGGCRWAGCDRPPAWCEAHHIDEWTAHGGRTDIADGILLCRFHHLMVHDQGWRIRRGSGDDSARYWAERRGPHERTGSDGLARPAGPGQLDQFQPGTVELPVKRRLRSAG